jgi:hypothetical protein
MQGVFGWFKGVTVELIPSDVLLSHRIVDAKKGPPWAG